MNWLLEMLLGKRQPHLQGPYDWTTYTDTPRGSWPGQNPEAYSNKQQWVPDLLESFGYKEEPYDQQFGQLASKVPPDLLMKMLGRFENRRATEARQGLRDTVQERNVYERRYLEPDGSWQSIYPNPNPYFGKRM